MKPTIGRIVLYVEGVDNRMDPVLIPAIIQAVDENSVRLCAFREYGPTMIESATEGKAVGQWCWPPRV